MKVGDRVRILRLSCEVGAQGTERYVGTIGILTYIQLTSTTGLTHAVTFPDDAELYFTPDELELVEDSEEQPDRMCHPPYIMEIEVITKRWRVFLCERTAIHRMIDLLEATHKPYSCNLISTHYDCATSRRRKSEEI